MAPGSSFSDIVSKSVLERILNITVTDFIVTPGSQLGDNIQSTLLAVTVTDSSKNTYNLIHKSFPGGAGLSPTTLKFFKNEIIFYTRFLPMLQQIRQQPIPKFLDGLTDGENDFLCMEDLRPSGYKMLDKYSGLPFEEASIALRDIAKFHASTYQLLRYQGEQIFEDLPPEIFENIWVSTEGVQTGQAWFPGFYQTMIGLLSKEKSTEYLAEAMKSIPMDQIYEIVVAVSRKTDTKYFPLIIHGDLWMNNILFRYENGAPVEAKLIDFQQARRGNVVEELLYFIFTSTTPDIRKKHLQQLLAIYYDSFKTELEGLRCPIPIGFTKGYFIDSFMAELLTPFMYLTFAIPLQLNEVPLELSSNKSAEEDTIPDQAFVNRLRFIMQNSPRAIQRFELIAREFVELNMLPHKDAK